MSICLEDFPMRFVLLVGVILLARDLSKQSSSHATDDGIQFVVAPYAPPVDPTLDRPSVPSVPLPDPSDRLVVPTLPDAARETIAVSFDPCDGPACTNGNCGVGGSCANGACASGSCSPNNVRQSVRYETETIYSERPEKRGLFRRIFGKKSRGGCRGCG